MSAEPNVESLSLVRRIVGIFTHPSGVFRDIERRHNWLAALLILSTVSLAATLPLLAKIKEYSLYKLQQMDHSALESPEALHMIDVTATVSTLAASFLLPLLFALLMALLLKLYNTFAGEKVPYRKLFSVCVYAGLPLLLAHLVTMVVGSFTPVESFGNVSTSLYLLFPPDTYTFPAMFASQVDFFMLWSLYLVALGGAILMKSRVKSVGVYIFLVWLVYALGYGYYSAMAAAKF